MYEDNTVRADDTGITITRYGLSGAKRILYSDIRSVEVFELGFGGRWRVIGLGPGGGWSNWYNWDTARRNKTIGIAIDAGGRLRATVTPDHPDEFIKIISGHVEVA
jgi:hypothetical protein